MGGAASKETEVTGLANTNVVVEQGPQKIDMAHTILLMIILILALLELAYIIFRQYQKQMKKKYLERMHTLGGPV